ncbi:MAG: hypothetical protein JW923_06745 [Spirochaetales bacterium]|nr:hypothetical protein [Spirochaetales bacterium]MBP7264316.1 hypothetical protein [Spirochaetia bacterium]
MDGRNSRRIPTVSWVALILGVVVGLTLLGILQSWFLPRAGLAEAWLIGLVSVVATVLSVWGTVKQPRSAITWIAAVVSASPLLFLLFFLVGNLLGPTT